jgi:hypothetical protein
MDLMKPLLMFQSSKMQFQRLASSGVRNLIHGRGNPIQNAKTILLFHVVLPATFQLIANGFKWNWTDEEKAAALGNLNELAIAGHFIDALGNTLVGDAPWKRYEASPVLSIPENAISGVQHLEKVKQSYARMSKNQPEAYLPYIEKAAREMPFNWTEALKAASYLSKSVGDVTGLPIQSGINIATGTKAVIEGEQQGSTLDKILRIMGESKYTLGNATTDSGMTPEEVEQQFRSKKTNKK